jgi:HTH-type transcriptional regulator/antitoxin HigA
MEMKSAAHTKPVASAAHLDLTQYGELLKALGPKVIKNERENRLALRWIEMLMDQGDDGRSAEQSAMLDLLVTLVESFEKSRYPVPEAEPVEALKMLMESNDLKAADMAEVLGSRSKVSEILSGKRAISKEQAKRLGARFHVSPALFI